ncbi:MAG TPA: hypothetical protein VJ821_07640, partial [Anaerolineales bacterium]|nr:hypothetical protein [Anaerolineales bacterium]
MKTNTNRFWTIVILLGWAADFLFWKKPLGINFAIYATLCLSTGMLLLHTDGLRLARRSGLLLLPIAFLAAMTFIRLEPITVFLSIATVLFLMGVIALTYLNGEWLRYSLFDYVLDYLQLFISMIARPLGFAAQNRREQPSLSPKRGTQVWPVVRGTVIALPV